MDFLEASKWVEIRKFPFCLSPQDSFHTWILYYYITIYCGIFWHHILGIEIQGSIRSRAWSDTLLIWWMELLEGLSQLFNVADGGTSGRRGKLQLMYKVVTFFFSGGWVEYGKPKHQEIFLSKKVKKWREFLLLSGFCCEIVWFDKMNNYKWSKFGLTKFVWWVHHQPQEIWTSVGLDLIPWAGIRWRWKSSKFWNQHWIYDLFGSNMGTYCRGSHGGGEGLMRWFFHDNMS